MHKNKLLTAYAVLVFAFLGLPLLIITVTAFGGGSAITFPIESFSLKWFANVFALKSFRRSFLTSLEVALLATLIALLVGIPAAYALARSQVKGKQMLKSIFLSPTFVSITALSIFLVRSPNATLSYTLRWGNRA